MISPQIRQSILKMHAAGNAIRDISRKLRLSRNTIRNVIRQGVVENNRRIEESKIKQDVLQILPDLFKRCCGNAVRIKEILQEEYKKTIGYSTITHWCREYQIREPKKRAGIYTPDPGIEMQHDTSPHCVIIAGKKVTAQCASLVFSYSRKRFIQYYPRFTRFEAKIFLSEALQFMDGVCQNCIIDNTSVILSGGAGSEATISAEMEVFCRIYGFKFIAHAVYHADRKARVERRFHHAENNFLVGRTFSSWEDLNNQSRVWSEAGNNRIMRELGTTPNVANIQEKAFLKSLPAYVPAIYKLEDRIVDSQGYIHFETNRYPVPDKLINKTVEVYIYKNYLEVNYQHKIVAKHPLALGMKYYRLPADQYHQSLVQSMEKVMSEAEGVLRNENEIISQYIDELKKRVRGRGIQAIQRLLNLMRLYPKEAFLKAVAQAKQYGLYDINRLENIILQFVTDEFFQLGEEDI
jgi:Homeodomain-like domain